MFKFNNKDNRKPFDRVVLVHLFLSFNFSHVSYLVLVFSLSNFMKMSSSIYFAVIGNHVERPDMY